MHGYMPNKKKQLESIRTHSVEYAQFRAFRMISLILYLCFGMLLILCFWFLYTRMYQTIGQVESIAALSPAATVQVLEIEKYETVSEFISNRGQYTPPQLVRDPFNRAELYQPKVVVVTSSMDTISTTPSLLPSSSTLEISL